MPNIAKDHRRFSKIGKDWQRLAKIGEDWQRLAKIGKDWQRLAKIAKDWVNQSKRGEPCQPEESPVHPNSFTWICILFKIGHFGDIPDFFQILMFEEA